MSIGLNANNDGSGSVQIGGSDAITITSGLAVAIPQTLTVTGASTLTGNTSVTGNLTLTGNASGIIKSGTAVASTSGTSIDFTGIPSTAKRITVMLNGVSVSGTSITSIQIGSGSVANTGYISTGTSTSSGGTSAASSTAMFLTGGTQGAATNIIGQFFICNVTGNTWTFNGGVLQNTAQNATGYGSVTLGGVLDRVRITTVNGTDTFDAGTINIMWE